MKHFLRRYRTIHAIELKELDYYKNEEND